LQKKPRRRLMTRAAILTTRAKATHDEGWGQALCAPQSQLEKTTAQTESRAEYVVITDEASDDEPITPSKRARKTYS
jgi:hypothetical protein